MLVMNNVDNSEVIMKIRLLLNSIIGNVLKFKVWFHLLLNIPPKNHQSAQRMLWYHSLVMDEEYQKVFHIRFFQF